MTIAPFGDSESWPLDRPSVLVGRWWLPGQEDHVATGRVTYSAESGLEIDLQSLGFLLPIGDEVPVMLGTTIHGLPITLRGVRGTRLRSNAAGGHVGSGTARFALVGMHAERTEQITFQWLKARVTSLTEWIGVRAFDALGAHRLGGTVSFKPAPLRVMATVAGKTYGVFEDVRGIPKSHGAKTTSIALEQQSWAYVRGRYRRHLDELMGDLASVVGLVSFIAGRDCPILEIVGEATVPAHTHGGVRLPRTKTQVSVLCNRTVHGVTPTDPRFMLFTFGQAEARDFTPIKRWLRRRPLLEPVYNLYLSAIPTQSPKIEFRFLALAQALDAYFYRRFPQSPWIDYVDVVRAVERELPHDVRRSIPSGFAELVRDTRHYFTHWNARYERRAAKGDDLGAMVFGLLAVVEMLLLRELGFSRTEVSAIAQHNLRVSQRIRTLSQL